MDDDDLRIAHAHCGNHRTEIMQSDLCGCFYCRHTFPPDEILEWIDEHDGVGTTALCPHCGIDSVLGSASGLRLTPEFLDLMQRRYFS